MTDKRWTVQYGTQTPFEITSDDLDRMQRDYHDERGDRAKKAALLDVGNHFTYYDASVERHVTVRRAS